MSRSEAWFSHATNLVVGGSGLVYAWMLYLCEPTDEFSIVNHPWQPDLQHIHVLAAPFAVFALGLIWVRHVWTRVRNGHPTRRKTGLILAAAAWPMITSGYAIQVSVDPAWRDAWIWVHLIASFVWVPIYLIHQLGPRGQATD
ncbi:MAG: hypothetical protein AAFZ65_02020 [Planctomycetota bacterium]